MYRDLGVFKMRSHLDPEEGRAFLNSMLTLLVRYYPTIRTYPKYDDVPLHVPKQSVVSELLLRLAYE